MTKLFVVLLTSVVAMGDVFAVAYKYQGEVFPVEERLSCEAEFKRISSTLERFNEFVVLDGGCLAYGQKKLVISFRYEALGAAGIDSFKIPVGKRANCQAIVSSVKTAISNAKNIFLAGFCASGELRVDYLDRAYTMVKNLKTSAKFSSLNNCEQQLGDIKKAMASNEMYPLYMTCAPYKSLFEDYQFYRIKLFYMTDYRKSLEVLAGRQVSGDCLAQGAQIDRAFELAGLVLAHKFCSDKTKYNNPREFLIYLNKNRVATKQVREYQGLAYSNLVVCENELKVLEQKFEKLGRKNLYTFCDLKGKESFVPKIYYKTKK